MHAYRTAVCVSYARIRRIVQNTEYRIHCTSIIKLSMRSSGSSARARRTRDDAARDDARPRNRRRARYTYAQRPAIGRTSMVLVHACVMPHGAMVLDPSMQDLPDGAAQLHEANVATAAALAASEPELIVLTTPHGMALDSAVGVYKHATIEGTAAWAGAWEDYTVSGEGDGEAADSLVDFVRGHNVDVAPITGPGMYAPLRWGEAVPMWFLQQAGVLVPGGSKVLIISWPTCRLQARDFTPVAMAFGRLLAEWASKLPRRVAVLASCDMSHAHRTPPGALSIYTSPIYSNEDATPELAESFDNGVVNWAHALSKGDVAEAGKQLDNNFSIVDEAKACGWTVR